MSEDFFIKINDPTEIRKYILESSKEILKCMHKYEDIESIRRKKLTYLMQLRQLMKETTVLMTKFRTKLPREKLARLPKRFDQTMKQEFVRAPSSTEIEDLSREISHIEEKLSKL